jgi:hypothetical protein
LDNFTILQTFEQTQKQTNKMKLTSISNKLQKAAIIFVSVVVPAVGFGQPPGPGDGGGGGNPDGVPFNDNMNLIFLAVGLVFALVVLKKVFFKGTAVKA